MSYGPKTTAMQEPAREMLKPRRINLDESGPIMDSPVMKKRSQISEQYEIYAKLISTLSDEVSSLEKQFDAVLRPEPNCGGCDEKEPETLAPLANALRVQNRALNNVITRIRSISNRNEL